MSDFTLEIYDTPNPTSKRFVVNVSLLDMGYFEAFDSDNIMPLLFADILNAAGVRRIFVEKNSITVTLSEHAPWGLIEKRIAQSFYNHLEEHKPNYHWGDKGCLSISPEMDHIERILDLELRPFLRQDGGNVVLRSYFNNKLKIVYKGACKGCVHSTKSTLALIEKTLRDNNFPNIKVEIA